MENTVRSAIKKLPKARYQEYLKADSGQNELIPQGQEFESDAKRVIVERYYWSNEWNRFILGDPLSCSVASCAPIAWSEVSRTITTSLPSLGTGINCIFCTPSNCPLAESDRKYGKRLEAGGRNSFAGNYAVSGIFEGG